MKLVAKLLIASLALSQVSVMTASASSAGSACKKLGANKKVKKAEFICTKVGKKRVWVKAKLPIAAPIPTPLPSPAPSTVLSPLPTPSPSRTPQYLSASEAKVGADCLVKGEYAATLNGPVSCEGVWTLIPKEKDSVASRAYRYVLEEYLAQPEGALSIIWRIDSATPDWKNQIEKGVIAGARLWGTSPVGSEARYSYISHDPDWLFTKFMEDGLIKNVSRRENMFQGKCNAGLTGSDGPLNVSFWFFKFSEEICTDGIGFYQVPAHEYTHYAQEVLTKTRFFSGASGKIPWLDEGLASFIGAALSPMSDMPRNLQSLWADESKGTERSLLFFSEPNRAVYTDSRWQDVYSTGALAAEAMTAILGFKKVKDIYSEIGTPNATYESALIKVTGIGKAAWVEVLQGYVDSVKRSNAWSLPYLLEQYEKKKTS